MPDLQHVRFNLERSPAPGIDPSDVASVRAAVLRTTDDIVGMIGGIVSQLVFVGQGYTDTANTDGMADLGQEAMIAMVLRSYGQGEPLRRFRRGEVVIDGRRVVAVLEMVPGEPDRWWRALRRIGTGAAHVGVFHGDWDQREGEGLDGLEEVLHEWVDVSKVELAGMERNIQPKDPDGDIRMAVAEVAGDLPEHPCAIAAFLGNMLDAELLSPGTKPLFLFAFRPGVLERWEVRGRLGCGIDDFARAVAGQGPVDAMAVVHPAVIDMPDGSRKRCFVTMVERNGRMGQRVLPLDLDGGTPRALEPLFRERPSTDGWIGVKPKVEVNMQAVGPLEMAPGSIPEGEPSPLARGAPNG